MNKEGERGEQKQQQQQQRQTARAHSERSIRAGRTRVPPLTLMHVSTCGLTLRLSCSDDAEMNDNEDDKENAQPQQQQQMVRLAAQRSAPPACLQPHRSRDTNMHLTPSPMVACVLWIAVSLECWRERVGPELRQRDRRVRRGAGGGPRDAGPAHRGHSRRRLGAAEGDSQRYAQE